MYNDELLSDCGDLIYEGRDLRAVARKMKVSVADLRKDLEIPLSEVDLLTTVRELKEAYKVLSDDEKKNLIIERMETYCSKKLESIPKNMEYFHKIRNIYHEAFDENKSKKEALDWINKISLDFLKNAKVDDIEGMDDIYRFAEDVKNVEILELIDKIYTRLCHQREENEKIKNLKKIEEIEDLEKLTDLIIDFRHNKAIYVLLEKIERRCREEALKAAVLKDYKMAKKIYLMCPRTDRFSISQEETRDFVLSIWKKICLSLVENDAKVMDHLWEEDYLDDQEDYPTIQPGAYEILDEIYVGRIIRAKDVEEVISLKKEAPKGWCFMMSESLKLAEDRINQFFAEKLISCSVDEAEEIRKSLDASYEIQKMAIRRIFELSSP